MEALYTLPVALACIVLGRWRFGRWIAWAVIGLRLLACVVVGGINTFMLEQPQVGIVTLAIFAVAFMPVPYLLRAAGIDSARARTVAVIVAAIAGVAAIVGLLVFRSAPATARLPGGKLILTHFSWKDLVAGAIASCAAGAAGVVSFVVRKRPARNVRP